MRQLLTIAALFFLSACGMKGDLYESAPPPPASAPAATPDSGTNEDRGERKQIPATPEPAESR